MSQGVSNNMLEMLIFPKWSENQNFLSYVCSMYVHTYEFPDYSLSNAAINRRRDE